MKAWSPERSALRDFFPWSRPLCNAGKSTTFADLVILIGNLSYPMLIHQTHLQHWITHFYGYGSWKARFWFISHEEGGGDLPEEVADKINYFYKPEARTDEGLCDIRDLGRHVVFRGDGPKASSFKTMYEHRFDKNAVQHNVWKNLIAFTHGFGNEKLPDMLAYQQQNFLSPEGQREALIRLFPLPSPHNHAWYYSWLDVPQLPFLKSRALYQEHLYSGRIRHVLSNISKHKPEFVLMYGMENINKLKASVQHFFPEARFRMIKATVPAHHDGKTMAGKIPQHHRIDLKETTLLITTQVPALRHNRIETGFDWEAFGKSVKFGEW